MYLNILGIGLEKNYTSPPSSPSSNGSTPSGDSQSSFDSNQVFATIYLLSFSICNIIIFFFFCYCFKRYYRE